MGGLRVIGELAEIGYDAEWRVISAAGVGAPHRRERIIILAYPNGTRLQRRVWTQEVSQASSGFDDSSKASRWGNHWIIEPGICRVANGIPQRMDKLRGLGNAVVPQVAEYIGRLLMAAELNNS